MFIFQELQLKEVPAVVGWYLKIDTVDQLMDYYNLTIPTKCEIAFKDYLSAYLYDNHHRDRYAAKIMAIAKLREDTFLNTMQNVNTQVLSNQLVKLLNGFIVYINAAGGHTYDYNTYNVLRTVESDKLVFPHNEAKDVRYIKWPQGKHWYAKLGNIDIIDSQGNQKWNTKEEAEEAALKYIEGD